MAVLHEKPNYVLQFQMQEWFCAQEVFQGGVDFGLQLGRYQPLIEGWAHSCMVNRKHKHCDSKQRCSGDFEIKQNGRLEEWLTQGNPNDTVWKKSMTDVCDGMREAVQSIINRIGTTPENRGDRNWSWSSSIWGMNLRLTVNVSGAVKSPNISPLIFSFSSR